MEWLACLKDTIEYMESNLTEIRSPEEVAEHVNVSCMYLQRGFQIMTGYTLGEYMRNRKLYLAAVELTNTCIPVIDIALKYGYETPSSFNKAFVRFHGSTPMDIRKARGNIRSFLRLNISISVQGGDSMQFRIEKKDKIKVVGFERTFSGENSYEMIPKFWDEMIQKYCPNLMKGLPPVGTDEEYVAAHHIGEFGVCIDDIGTDGMFHYIIAGYYNDDTPLRDMVVREIEAGDWAVFDCTLETLQSTNTAIWKDWIPGNSEYELAGKYNIEWYSPEGEPGPTQKCQIWFPVKKRNQRCD